MWNRIRQVISALTAVIEPQDRRFIEAHLEKEEQKLFWQMNLPDQRHVLNVAYTALQLSKAHLHINHELLVKCALLHDVGKIKGDVSTLDKIITVLAHNLFPAWAKRWGRCGRGGKLSNLRHAFYVYFHHPERSAALLAEIGLEAAALDIIAKHHKAPADGDPPELVLLRRADNMH